MSDKPHKFCNRGHPLSGDNLKVTSTQRYCRTCLRERRRMYKKLYGTRMSLEARNAKNRRNREYKLRKKFSL